MISDNLAGTWRLIKTLDHHPGDEKDKTYETQIFESNNHLTAEQLEKHFIPQGWEVWLASNIMRPGFVVFRKKENVQERV